MWLGTSAKEALDCCREIKFASRLLLWTIRKQEFSVECSALEVSSPSPTSLEATTNQTNYENSREGQN
jgi:hypothetical protein